MAPADLPAAALAFVNQISAMDVDVDYVTLRFDSQTKELGLTYSDDLKTALGLGSNHYTLFSPPTDGQIPGDVGGGDSAASAALGTASYYLDPFNFSTPTLSCPLPEAFLWAAELIGAVPDHDHVVVKVSSMGWDGFYAATQQAGQRFADFAATAVNIRQRFGFASFPGQPAPEISVIPAGAGYAQLADWVGRYDQVYSAVLVIRFTAGTVPKEFLS